MKTMISLFCALMMVLCVSGCQTETEKKPTTQMYFQPAELTEEEKKMETLLKADSQGIYEYQVGEEVQSKQIMIYELEDGKWSPITSSTTQQQDTEGRMALFYDKISQGITVSNASEHNSGSWSYSPGEDESSAEEDEESMSCTTSRLSEKTPIVYGKEIPLAIQILTSKNEVHSYVVEYFEKPEEYEKLDYEHVYAITITFSEKTVDDLSQEMARKVKE